MQHGCLILGRCEEYFGLMSNVTLPKTDRAGQAASFDSMSTMIMLAGAPNDHHHKMHHFVCGREREPHRSPKRSITLKNVPTHPTSTPTVNKVDPTNV